MEIISLIDIVFLLLIFGLVLSAFSRYKSVSEDEREEAGTPKSLAIHVYREATGELTSPNLVKIIYPHGGPVYSGRFPPDSILLRLGDTAFAALPASRLIATHLREYTYEYLSDADTSSLVNRIDVRVADDTIFRIVGYIMGQCSRDWRYISWINLGIVGREE
jgi:hypothetical protein